jgi:subtilisin-like proprotein convertase family protein
LSNDSVLHIELNGPVAGVSYDQLRVFGSLTLTGSKLAPSLGFAPFEGEVFTIIDNNGTDAVVGTFDNLANGAITNVQGVPMRINYNGITGNDVTLTVTNLPVRGSTVTVATGNGDGHVDPNECNLLFLRVTNSSGAPLTNVQATLSSTTPGVIITEPFSAYPDMKTLGAAGTNLTAFQFFTDANFLCGQSVEFLLTLVASNQTPFAVRFVLQSGSLVASRSFTNNTGVAIPPVGATASPIVVSNVPGGIAKVTVSMALTHQNLSELQLLLIPPFGPAIPLVAGLPGTQLGTNCTNGRLTFDDDASLPIEAGSSPYVGTFRPDAPLSLADGKSANGTWLLEIIDTVANSSVGALSCWSVTITHANCAAGSGPCSICNGPFFGSIDTNDLVLNGHIQTVGAPSTCGSVNFCSALSGSPTHYDTFTFTNGGPASCVTVTLDSPCTASSNALTSTAYLTAFNPANVCQNYAGGIGSFTNSPSSFSFQVPSNAVFVVVVDGSPQGDCSDYTLRVDGFDCPVRLGAGRTSDGRLIITWPNFANGFNMEWKTNLLSTNWLPFTNVPISLSGDFVITNDITAPSAFYRLRK